jgi:pimeloyl-ACP methyl ester carboxylesterase
VSSNTGRLLVAGIVLAAAAGVVANHTATRWIPRLLITAPNLSGASGEPKAPEIESYGVVEQLHVEVGDVTLRAAVIDPIPSAQPVATLLFLHDVESNSRTLLDLARACACSGFRSIAVDLRGHGRSTGSWLGYGAFEATDISLLLDKLQSDGWIEGRIGVFGLSYGASVALKLAGTDARIGAVVAVAPFSSMSEVVPSYLRRRFSAASLVLSAATLEKVVLEAARIAGFDPAETDLRSAVASTQAKLLFLHGANDLVVPVEHSQRLYRQAPEASQLVVLPTADHETILLDSAGATVLSETQMWFVRWLVDSAP